MSNLITSRDISTSLFCERKLYYESVSDVHIESSSSLRHKILDEALAYTNKAEDGILKSIKEATMNYKIVQLYEESNHRAMQEAILNHKEAISNHGLSIIEISQALNKELMMMTYPRIEAVTKFIALHNRYGTELSFALNPKISFNIKTKAPKLGVRVRIDRIDNYENGAEIFIFANGEAPREGLWESDKLILATCMLAFKEFGMQLKGAYMLYHKEKRSLVLSPELEEKVIGQLEKIKVILNSSSKPKRVSNTKKCDSCSLREHCFKDSE